MKKNFLYLILLSVFIASCSSDDEFDRKLKFIEEERAATASSIMGEKAAEDYIRNFLSRLPKPFENSYWLRNNYVPAENLKLNSKVLKDFSEYDVGSEPKQGMFITSAPVVADGVIYTIAGKGEVQARSFSDPDRILWQRIVEKEYLSENREHGFYRNMTNLFYDSDSFLGGNIAYSLGKLFVSTKRGNVFALNAKTGETEWVKKLGVPARSTPNAQDGVVIVSTINNKTYAYDALSGKTLWHHEGLGEKSKIFATPTPVIKNGVAYIPYSSGEMYALELKTGIEKWSTITTPQKVALLNPSLNDISHDPILHRGNIIIVTSDGRMILIDKESGDKIWELEGHAIDSTPWAISDFIFAKNKFGKLIAVAFKTGKVAWKENLDDPETIDEENLIFTSPIVAGNKIFIADNESGLRAYSTRNGKLEKMYIAPEDVYIKPVVVKGKVLLISNEAELAVYN